MPETLSHIPPLVRSLWVGAGAFVGANARYWLGELMRAHSHTFPWATFAINITGSFLIGLFMGYFVRDGWDVTARLLWVVGMLGGYTTFSSFAYESIHLIQDGRWKEALAYVVLSCVLGLSACVAGLALVPKHA